METKQKTKQIVVNVSDESKATITTLKEKFNVSDKEFIAAALIILGNTSDDDITSAVTTVTIEKQKAKIAAKIAKIEAQLVAAKAEATATPTEEVVYDSAEEATEEVAA
jgi:hypothetical protein